MSTIVVEHTRGPLVESLFRGDAALVDGTGRLLMQVGSAAKKTYWRSSAKPIQAMPIILSGAADAFGFEPNHLALFCASHNGDEIHTATALEVLQKAGLGPEYLQCGAHLPYDKEAADRLLAAGLQPGAIHNNCSGKHSGMLSLAAHLGLPLENYLEPDSSLQQLILANVADVVGLQPDQISIGVDGCGVPVFGLPLLNMAYSFARLANPEQMPSGKSEAARRLRDAMMQHPHNVAGRNRICTEIMSLPGRRWVAKSGAEGVYCIGLLPETVQSSPQLREAGAEGGVGIAIKAETGSADVRHMMLFEILSQLGLLTEADRQVLSKYGPQPIKNHAGRLVGERRPAFILEPAR